MRYRIRIRGTSPIIFNRPSSKDECKRIIGLPDREQAEYRCYRNEETGNIAVYNSWIKGCIREYYTRTAPNKMKGSYYNEISPSISILPMYINLGIKDYDIRKVPIMIKKNGKVATIEEPAQPIVKSPWNCEFLLDFTLDKPREEVERLVNLAGKYIGIGSNIINGYGRFEVTSFERVED